MREFCRKLLTYLHQSEPELWQKIGQGEILSEEIKKELVEALETFRLTWKRS